jgi:hypothetical protein
MNMISNEVLEMGTVLQKITQHMPLGENELTRLTAYAERLRIKSPESYRSFYDLYADILYRDYDLCLTRFRYGRDDFYDYLMQNPDFLNNPADPLLSLEDFPPFLQEYLRYSYGSTIDQTAIHALQALLGGATPVDSDLPAPRQRDVVYKYENGNSYKELGLKSHFEKIGRQSFVSRIQSYRYLRGNKSSTDKIEVLGPDYLGGIFTNKEKSIYYYIFLTESNYQKAVNACRLLNTHLYGR